MKQRLTPHGPGFSFIDSIEIVESGHLLRASKWLDPKSPFFGDHFPGNPMMPGVLLVECAAQAAGALWGSIQKQSKPKAFMLAKVQDFRFKQPVLPGQTLTIEVTLEKDFGALAQFNIELSVAGKPVAGGSVILSSSQATSP